MASFRAAAGHAVFSEAEDFRVVLTDQPGRESWPLVAATYMLLHRDGPPAANRTILKFMDYVLRDGRLQAERLRYVPLSGATVEQIEGVWPGQLHAWP
jgi:phosphate transport system substrate-binding protein